MRLFRTVAATTTVAGAEVDVEASVALLVRVGAGEVEVEAVEEVLDLDRPDVPESYETVDEFRARGGDVAAIERAVEAYVDEALFEILDDAAREDDPDHHPDL